MARASFNHSCVKTPVDPVSKMPSPGYERCPGRPLSSSIYRGTPSPARNPNSRTNSACKASRTSSASKCSRASSAAINRPNSGSTLKVDHVTSTASLGPLLSFYESIPDYSELGHLSDRDFYAKVRELRETQRAHITQLADSHEHQRPRSGINKGTRNNDERWTAGVQGVRCVLNESRGATPVGFSFTSPSSSARSGAIPAWANHTASPLSASPAPRRPNKKTASKGHTPDRVRGNSQSRVNSARRSRIGSVWDEEEDWEDEGMFFLSAEDSADEARAVQTSRHHKNVAWREPQFTLPQPFEMTRREEEERYYSLLRRELLGDVVPRAVTRTPSPQRRSHEVPLTSRIPLFHGILLQQELRRERDKRRSKARLLSQIRPFSFDIDEPPARKLVRMRKLWQSSPELRDLSRVRGGGEFKARPMPRHLYGSEAILRHQEEDYLRHLRRRVRAEETLRDSSLPPSMASRTILSHPQCRPISASIDTSTPQPHHPRRQLSAPLTKSSGGHYNHTVSPYEESESVMLRHHHEQTRHQRRQSSVSPIRNNLAAVLRIENCRRRAEREAALRLEQRRSLEEARARARVLRRRPAWRQMTRQASAQRELEYRAVERREEERSRQEDHARHMGRMMGRVLNIPTLFERQTQASHRYRNLQAPERREERSFCRSPLESSSGPTVPRKFIAPTTETHISFYPGTRNGADESSAGDEKHDLPEFDANEKHDETPREHQESRRNSLQESRRPSLQESKKSSSRQASRQPSLQEERDTDTPCTEPVT